MNPDQPDQIISKQKRRDYKIVYIEMQVGQYIILIRMFLPLWSFLQKLFWSHF